MSLEGRGKVGPSRLERERSSNDAPLNFHSPIIPIQIEIIPIKYISTESLKSDESNDINFIMMNGKMKMIEAFQTTKVKYTDHFHT